MTDIATLNRLRLPALLRVVAEVSGVVTAMKLSQAKGGSRIYVPHKVTSEHWLVALIGMPAAVALQERHGGETIDVPLGLSGSMQNARAIARRAVEEGASVAQAANAAGLTERGVYKLMSREGLKASERQLSLFDDASPAEQVQQGND